MGTNHTGCVRGFHHFSAAWYGRHVPRPNEAIDTVNVGFYHPEGGTTGEFSFDWVKLSGKVVPILKAFDDGWHALSQCKDMLDAMGEVDKKSISPADFCALLLKLGFVDLTARERTHGD